MAKYTDEFRAGAIAMLTAAGFDTNKAKAVEQVSRYYKGQVSERTLYRWGNGENSPAPAKLVRGKKEELADVFERVAYKYLQHAEHPDVIDDEMRLLRGLPTEIISIIPDLVSAIQRSGDDPEQVFKRLLQRANERANARTAG